MPESAHWQHNVQPGEIPYNEANLPQAGPISSQPRGEAAPGSALIAAAMKGREKRLVELIEMGADVNFRDEHGWSAVMHASSEGQILALTELLKHGPDLSFRDLSDGWTALHYAATAGSVAIASLLIKAGAPMGLRDVVNWTPLMHVAGNNVELLKVMLEAKPGPEILNMEDQMGFTPLHEAAGNGNLEATRQLVMAGANPNAVDDYGDTPLKMAQQQGFGKIVAVLKGGRKALLEEHEERMEISPTDELSNGDNDPETDAEL
jgi:ankyrin repeat protein